MSPSAVPRLSTRFCLLLLSAFASGALSAQPSAPSAGVAADVVVSAAATPTESKELGVAVTVLSRDEIERSRKTTLLELLRLVPGFDVAQSGGAGGVTSGFLRGANSNQTLVLVDGVKLNSPYFGGFDFSTLPATDVERIEVVRGPFSALYGSEAVGGVVQVFTRRGAAASGAGPGVSASGSFAAGNAGTLEGTLGGAVSRGSLSASAGFRRVLTEGELPNDFFSATNASGSVDVALSPDVRVGLVVRRDDSTTGVPFAGSRRSPRRKTTFETTTFALPVSAALGAGTTLDVSASFGKDRPTLDDPDDPFGFTRAATDSERVQGRVVLSRAFGPQRLSVGADYERTKVFNQDSYAVELDDVTARTWSVFAEDRVALLGDRLVATLGVRRDDHSAFGGATNPRVALAFQATNAVKLRAAAGKAFRSPTAGELHYPFSGNAALEPERSTSVEAGADVSVGPRARLSATAYHTDVTDLIRYDFASGKNLNVGRARLRGVELSLVGELTERLFARAAYAWVDAVDRDAGRPLLRRPRHRASATLGLALDPWLGRGASCEATGLFVGRRDDVDAVTFARVTDASYVRLDAAVTGPRLLERVAPFVRVTNLLGREYTEVAGYPSPKRRWIVGLDVGF